MQCPHHHLCLESLDWPVTVVTVQSLASASGGKTLTQYACLVAAQSQTYWSVVYQHSHCHCLACHEVTPVIAGVSMSVVLMVAGTSSPGQARVACHQWVVQQVALLEGVVHCLHQQLHLLVPRLLAVEPQYLDHQAAALAQELVRQPQLGLARGLAQAPAT